MPQSRKRPNCQVCCRGSRALNEAGLDTWPGRLQKKTGTAAFVTGNHQEGEVEEDPRCVGLVL